MSCRRHCNNAAKKTKKRTDLFVRELGVDDAPLYLKIAHDEQINAYTSFFEATSIEQAKERITSNNTRYCRMYGLFTKANRLVGVYTVSDDALGGATVCYMIGERYRGQGYATTGLHLLSKLCAPIFQYFSFSIKKSNLASIKVQESLGSELVDATSRCQYFKLAIS